MSAWHVNPVVSRLELNAASAAVIDKDRATVTNLEKSADGLQWNSSTMRFRSAGLQQCHDPMLLQVSDIHRSIR